MRSALVTRKIILVLTLILISVLSHASSRLETSPQLINGVLDFSDNTTIQVIELNGKWDCYRNQFIDPGRFVTGSAEQPDTFVQIPGAWKSDPPQNDPNFWKGWFTFHLKVSVADPDKIYSIHTRHIGTAYRIFINERELGGNGIVSADEKKHKPGYKNQLYSFKPDEQTFHITIHTCNFYEAVWGYTRPILLGEEGAVRVETFADYSIDFAVAIFLIVLIFIFFIRYIIKKNLGYLFLSLTLLAVLMKNLFEDGKILPYFVNMTPMMNHSILYFAYILISVLLFFYFNLIFKSKSHKLAVIVFKVIGILLAIFSLIYPIYFNVAILTVYHIYTLSTIVFYFIFLIKSAVRKESGAFALIGGFTLLSLAAGIDVANTFGLVNIRFVAPAGFVIFGLIILINDHIIKLSRQAELTPLLKSDLVDAKEQQMEAYFSSLQLSEREREIAVLLIKGYNNKEIGAKIFVSGNTVKFHLKNIFQKAKVQNRMEILHKFMLFMQDT